MALSHNFEEAERSRRFVRGMIVSSHDGTVSPLLKIQAITVTTRSVLEVMYLRSKTVSVPEEHACASLVTESRSHDGSPFNWDDVL